MANQRATLTPTEPSVRVSPRRVVAIHGDFAVVGDPWRNRKVGEAAGAIYVLPTHQHRLGATSRVFSAGASSDMTCSA